MIIIVLLLGISLFIGLSLRPVSNNSAKITFKVNAGDNKITIVNNLKNAGVIRSKIAGLCYVFFSPGLNLQAGSYELDKADSTIKIVQKIAKGDIIQVIPTVRITFIEGKKFTDFAKLISTNFDISYDDIINIGADEEFLKSLINDYWFITDDILNPEIYYPLEGYLAPDTYEFYQNTDIETIIRKLIANMESNLSPLKETIEKSNYSIHELLTIASICEKEALNASDRATVAQVIYKRLDLGMTLGMDVTTYYGAFKEMGDDITLNLNDNNPYNTRNSNFIGLPVGSICNPSLESIQAALNPSDTDYIYFIADINTGEVFFFNTYEEFYQKKAGLN